MLDLHHGPLILIPWLKSSQIFLLFSDPDIIALKRHINFPHHIFEIASLVSVNISPILIVYTDLVNHLVLQKQREQSVITIGLCTWLRLLDHVPRNLFVDGEQVVVILGKREDQICQLAVTRYQARFKSEFKQFARLWIIINLALAEIRWEGLDLLVFAEKVCDLGE